MGLRGGVAPSRSGSIAPSRRCAMIGSSTSRKAQMSFVCSAAARHESFQTEIEQAPAAAVMHRRQLAALLASLGLWVTSTGSAQAITSNPLGFKKARFHSA